MEQQSVHVKQGRRPKPSDQKNNHKALPDGRSPTLTLTHKVAIPFFDLLDLLSSSQGKNVSKGAVVEWLLDNCSTQIVALKGEVAANKQRRSEESSPVDSALPLSPPRSTNNLEQIGGHQFPVPRILPDVSPARLLKVRKHEPLEYDEVLGYLDLDNELDFLADLSEEEEEADTQPPSSKASTSVQDQSEKEPLFFFTELAKQKEFLEHFPPVCPAQDCCQRMRCTKIVPRHQTVSIHLECSNQHTYT
jgi:hypothetical protein